MQVEKQPQQKELQVELHQKVNQMVEMVGILQVDPHFNSKNLAP